MNEGNAVKAAKRVAARFKPAGRVRQAVRNLRQNELQTSVVELDTMVSKPGSRRRVPRGREFTAAQPAIRRCKKSSSSRPAARCRIPRTAAVQTRRTVAVPKNRP